MPEPSWTPEQQANIDKALANSSLSKDIGGATNVTEMPTKAGPDGPDPAAPTAPQTPGVTMDK